jgi:hypothetical protein
MSISFGLRDGKIAPRTAVGTWGAAVDIPWVQMVNVTMRVLSAEGTGDDGIAAVGSRIIAGAGQCRMQGIPLAVLALITGQSTEAITINTIATTLLSIPAGARLAHFGIAGLGLNEDDLGDTILFAPNAVVTSDITLGSLEYGVLSSVEFTFTAIADGDYNILNLYARDDTADDLTIPPYAV